MNYRNKLKERNTRKFILNIFSVIKFTSINLNFSSKLIIIWSIISLISLFLPWVEKNQDLTWNSFNSIWWNIGYLMIMVLIFVIFIITSINFRERIKLASNINFRNHILILYVWILIIIIWIIYISFINWLTTIFDSVEVWNWIILYILWWIVIIIWWIFKRKEFKKREFESFINETNDKENTITDESNMKLPF